MAYNKKIDDNKYIELYLEGNTDAKIAEFFGANIRTVQKKGKKLREDGVLKYREDDAIVKENVRLAKQVQKSQDMNRIKNKAFREQARLENVVVEVQSELIRLIKTKTLPKSAYKGKKVIPSKKIGAIVHLTDLHFNELINLLCNKYDFTVASQRLRKFVQNSKVYLKTRGVKDICIAMTGDLMNSDRRLDEILAQATNRAKAVLLSTTLLEQVLLDFQLDFNVTVAHVIGNESRITKDVGWEEEVASDNYDTIIHGILKQIFKKSNIKFLDGSSTEKVIEICGQNILLIHGNQIKSTNMCKSIQQMKGKYAAEGIIIHFVISGHYHNCLDPKTPVLVKNKGFVPLKNITVNDIVYGYNNGKIVESKVNDTVSHNYNGKWYEFNSMFISQSMTSNHCIYDKNDNYMTIQDFLMEKSMGNLMCSASPLENKSDFPEIKDDFLRLLVAMCADGSYDENKTKAPNIRFHLKKPRKIQRLKRIFKALGYTIDFSENSSGAFKNKNFDISLREEIFKYLPTKQLPVWLLRLDSRQRQIVIDELKHWDGCQTGRTGQGVNSYQFFSSKQAENYLVQELLLKNGIMSTEHPSKQHIRSSIICHNDRKIWKDGKKVFKTLPKITNVENKPVACLVTSTSNFFIKTKKGKIELTGNSKVGDTYAQGSSLAGPNAYSRDALQLESRASQNLHIFEANGNRDSIKIDLQNVDGVEGYPIDKELECYNAKSVDKAKKKTTIHKIVI